MECQGLWSLVRFTHLLVGIAVSSVVAPSPLMIDSLQKYLLG